MSISKSVEDLIWKSFFTPGVYTKPRLEDLRKFSKQHNIKPSYILAILSNRITNHWFISHHKRVARLSQICASYKNNLLTLSRKFDIPPYQLYNWITKKCSLPSLERDTAVANDDYTTPEKQRLSQQQAERFERHIARQLEKAGIEYQTQDDLIKSGSRLTPDFLLHDPLYLDGKTIYWIDAKNYFAGKNPFTLKSLKPQAKKYNQAFGNGIFVFRYSYSQNLKIEGTSLISYKELKTKLTNKSFKT